MLTECGVEFRNNLVKSIYEKHQIHWYTTQNKSIKVAPVKRVVLTLKKGIKSYVPNYNTEKYLHFYNQMVDTYSKTPHSMLDGSTL